MMLEAIFVILLQAHTIAVLMILVPLWYLYATRNHNFWKKRGVPGPHPLPIVGNALDTVFSSGPEVEKQRYAKYGKIYGYFEGNSPILYIADPSLIKLICVKDWNMFVNRRDMPFSNPVFSKSLLGLKDERWKCVRSIVSPTFTSGKIRKMMDLMDDCVNGVLKNLDKAVEDATEIDIKRLFGAYTVDVIATCAFATKTDAHNNADDPFIKSALEIFKPRLGRIFAVALLPDSVRNFFKVDYVPPALCDFFKDLSFHLLKERKASKDERSDFVQLLVEAERRGTKLKEVIRDTNEDHFVNEKQFEADGEPLSTNCTDSNLTDIEAVAQMFIFFIAGYETTQTLLSYCAYCLALNPEVQEKLYNKLKKAFEGKEEVTYEDLNQIEYLNAVVSETLRLYPPVMKMDREASVDYKVPEMNLTIPKKTGIMLGFFSSHHDEDNFPEPYAFKPERFFKENLHKIKPYTYLPFGAGPRNCVGMRFALAEAKIVLVKVLLKYKFIMSQSTKMPLEYTPHPVLMQAKDITLGVERR